MDTTNRPSNEEISQAVDTLNRLPRGYLPFDLFIAVSAKITQPSYELLAIRVNQGITEVLLTQRPKDDPFWPGEWHMTGTIIRASDAEGQDFPSCRERVLRDEMHGVVKPIDEIEYAGLRFGDSRRAKELNHMFYFVTDVSDDEIQEGKFWPVDALPERTITHHRIMIPRIVDMFLAAN
ncbi:hypothetical protein GII36_05740 [Candidatus Mycosynbacter amalyticus]|uniref:Nudix hydrolase domain-containing protein n=1 Tax=Candidatus Mycosynbacter amalyticus TaxID=2665156 RepID=A0A857MRS8_9BACT|nr:hypothetical protein [Candidatus Mycosynbacter amalyticus]QHN43320.1 hypothetical protein GII36_05740 [Candidatus Mycosynbacter amalyticus]